MAAWGAAQIGGDDDSDSGNSLGERDGARADLLRFGPVLPDWPAPTPTPTPAPAHGPEPDAADAGPSPDPAASSATASPRPERAPDPGVAEGRGGETVDVWITFYTCPPYCSHPAGLLPLGEGQAACDPAWVGRRFTLNGREYVCNDTGSAVWGAHVDLFFWNAADGWAYLAEYGTTGRLTWR